MVDAGGLAHRWRDRAPIRRTRLAFAAMSLLFAALETAGSHVVATVPDLYGARMGEVFLAPATWWDVLRFLVAAALFRAALAICRRAAAALARRLRVRAPRRPAPLERVPARRLFAVALALFACYVPYLLAWWPGFVFADTVSSIWQHLGIAPLSNHHPVAYTAFLGAFMDAARALGLSNGTGLAMATAAQMAFLALTLGYLACWIGVRMGLAPRPRRALEAGLVALFGLAPYYASYAIAMWKDPLFSMGVVWLSVLTADHVLLGARSAWGPGRTAGLAAAALLTMFTRNNGLCIVGLLALALGADALRGRRARPGQEPSRASRRASLPGMRPVAALACCAVAFILVSGPVYDAMGVRKDTERESYGILLNQVARVVATGGSLTDGDRAYLDRLLPIDRWAQAYTPTNADHVKGAEGFDQAVLSEGFLGRWASIGLCNPRAYLEAWALETFGFWTVSNPIIWSYDANVSGGGVMNDQAAYRDMLAGMGIRFRDLLGPAGRALRPEDGWSVPVAAAAWVAAAGAVIAADRGCSRSWLPIVPSAALMLTLLVATPIHYWPRYAAALHFLLPLFLAWPVIAGERDAGDQGQPEEQVEEVSDDHAGPEQVRR